jgi:putative spermidine/putrescine transport system permease protein
MTITSPRHPFGLALWLVAAVVLFYILAPLAVIVAASFGTTGYVAFPPQGFSLQWYAQALANPRYVNGILTSLRIAGTVTLLSSAIGVAAAYALVRYRFPGARLVESLFLAPLMLPGLVLAVALTIFFARYPLATGTNRLILAHLTICVPCVIRIVIPVLQRFDRAIEEAALNLGASPVAAFFLVTLPVVRPGVVAAATLAFVMSFDEVDMSVFLASPREQPLTVALYSAVQLAFDPTLVAVSALLIMLTFAVMVAYQVTQRLRGRRSVTMGSRIR